MRKISILITSLLFAMNGYCQILIDNGPLVDPNMPQLRFSLTGTKWNKTNLTYYINNVSTHLTAAERQNIIQQAFQTWSAVSNLSFTQVSNASSADLKLSWKTGDHGDGDSFDGLGGILAHAGAPPPSGGSYAGQIHFDDDEPWTTITAAWGINLLSVAIHEIGHALGLGHSNVSGSIMQLYYSGQTTLGVDDIQAMCSLYSGTNITAQCGCDGSYHYGRIMPPFDLCIDRFEWQCSGTITAHPVGDAVSMDFVRISGGNGSLYVRAHNACGWSDWKYVGYLSPCNNPYSLAVSPNPAFNLLNIEIEVPQSATANAAPIQQVSSTGNASPPALPQLTVYEVKIFNTATGAMVYQQTMKGTSKQIDVSGLPNGIYTLNISDGSDNPPMTQQIVVAH